MRTTFRYTWFALRAVSMVSAAFFCGCGDTDPSAESDGGVGASGNTGGTADGDGGDSGTDAGSASATSAGQTLFDKTPQCPEGSGAFAFIDVQGKLGQFDVKYKAMGVSSNVGVGHFSTVDFEGTEQFNYVSLNFSRGLKPGDVHPVTEGRLVIPDEFTGGAGPYCVLAGEIGSVPEAQKPTNGSTIHFRVTRIQKRTLRTNVGVCEGPEIDADLGGCIYRTNSYLP